jgi:ABC-2 type transport system permease protein
MSVTAEPRSGGTETPNRRLSAATSQTGAARIHDRGPRRYIGRRLGTAHAVRSLARHTYQRVLGLRRPARHKVLPFLSVIIAYLPAAVFVGVVALFPQQARQFRITYGQYYGFVTGAIVLFVTFVAPEALCPDRRYRTLSLYLASPLDRVTYLAAKAWAVASALALVTIGPLLLLLLGFVLQNAGPAGPVAVLAVLGRVLAAGAVLIVSYGALSMAVSSVTDRRAFAGAATFLLLALSQATAGFLVFGLNSSKWFLLTSLTRTPLDLVQRIYGNRGLDPVLPTGALAATVAATTLVSMAVVVLRYRSVQVTR